MTELIKRVAERAAVLAGTDAETAAAVAQAAVYEALARCRRQDMPEAMEAVVASIAADILCGADAEAVTEGDISVKFRGTDPWQAHAAALYTWRKIV